MTQQPNTQQQRSLVEQYLEIRENARSFAGAEKELRQGAIDALVKQGPTLVNFKGSPHVVRAIAGNAISVQPLHISSDAPAPQVQALPEVPTSTPPKKQEPTKQPPQKVTLPFGVKSDFLRAIRKAAGESLSDWAEHVITQVYGEVDIEDVPEDPGSGGGKVALYLDAEVFGCVDDFAKEYCPSPTIEGAHSRSAAIRRILAWGLAQEGGE